MQAYFARKSFEKKLRNVATVSWPRSGHHLLVRLLSSYFGDEFGYCEHHFKGAQCCKTFPCTQKDAIILTKNHDFDLSLKPDPDTPTIIQYRAFLPSVVSNFELHVRNGAPDTLASFAEFAASAAKTYKAFYKKWISDNIECERFILGYETLTSKPRHSLLLAAKFIAPQELIDEPLIHRCVDSVAGEKVENGKVITQEQKGVKADRDVRAFRFYDEGLFDELLKMSSYNQD